MTQKYKIQEEFIKKNIKQNPTKGEYIVIETPEKIKIEYKKRLNFFNLLRICQSKT